MSLRIVEIRAASAGALLLEDEVARRDEHLAGVPAGKDQVWCIIAACGQSDGLCMESPERFLVACSRRLCGDDDLPRWAEREGALVEEAMMKRAERERVRHAVGPARTVPLDVCGFKADGLLVEANGEAADGTAVAVRFEHLFGEARVSGHSPRG